MGLIIKKVARVELKNSYDNFYFEDRLDTSNEWIVKRTGIERRFFSDMPLSEMATKAVKNLRLTEEEIDRIKLLIVSTVGGDFIVPSISAVVHKNLNLNKEMLSLDMNMACAGFVGGTIIAEPFLKKGDMAIVVGAEKLSDFTNFKDRNTAIIFADGAGAVLYEKDDEPFYKDVGTIGDDKNLLLTRDEGFLKMEGREIFKFAIDEIPKSIKRVLEKSGMDVDLFVLHQANERIKMSIEKHFKGTFYSNIKNFANTSSASIPMALFDLQEKDELRNKKIVLSGFGGGLNYGSCIVRGEYEIK